MMSQFCCLGQRRKLLVGRWQSTYKRASPTKKRQVLACVNRRCEPPQCLGANR